MRIIVDQKEMQALVNSLKVKAPVVIEEMANNVLGNTAAEGRKSEQATSHSLQLGVSQHTVRRSKKLGVRVLDGVFLKRSKQGWVSTRYNTSNGPFRMASFSWELAKKPKTKQIGYTSQLANLWHRPSKPYRWASPEVGRPGELMSWRAEERRPVKYSWSSVRKSLEQSIPGAITRTENKYRDLNKFLLEDKG